MTALYLLIALVANASANICMKMGAERFTQTLPGIFQDPGAFFSNIPFFGGLVLFGTALMFYNLALSKMPLSIAYPIMTTVGFVLVVSYSVLVFGEVLAWWQWLGILLVLTGVLLLSQGLAQ